MIVETTFSMPYVFKVDADVRVKRSVKRLEYIDSGSVDGIVKEVSNSDAPIVLSYILHPGIGHEIRYFDGGFYAMAGSCNRGFSARYACAEFPKSRIPSPKKLASSRGGVIATLQIDRNPDMTMDEKAALGTLLRTGTFITPVLDCNVVNVHRSSKAIAEAVARDVLDSMLVVKRSLWIKIEEPRLVLHLWSRSNDRVGSPDIPAVYSGKKIDGELRPYDFELGSPIRTRFYSMLDVEAFEADAAEFRDVNRVFGYGISNISVNDPTVFKTDWRVNGKERQVRHAIRAFSTDIGYQSIQTVDAWVTTRDLLSKYETHGDEALLDEAMRTAIPFLVSSYDGDFTEEMEEVAEGVRLSISLPENACERRISP